MQETEIHREVFGKCVQDFDTRERLASTVDSLTATRRWLYTCRAELAVAWNESAGNRTASSAFDTWETYAANNLNQYTAVNRTIGQSEQLVLRSFSEGGSNNLTYDADGNLTNDGRNAYAYDCENRLRSVIFCLRQI